MRLFDNVAIVQSDLQQLFAATVRNSVKKVADSAHDMSKHCEVGPGAWREAHENSSTLAGLPLLLLGN